MDLSMFSSAQIAGAMVFTGLVVVFLALVGLWFIVALFGKAFTLKRASPSTSEPPLKASASAPVKVSAAAPPVVEAGIPGSVVAAIAGAVAAMTDGKGVVTSVSRGAQQSASAPVRGRRSPWAKAGIQQNVQPF